MHDDTIPAGLCQCGCGQKTTVSRDSNRTSGRVKGQPARFRPGHNAKRDARYGADNNRYNGGLSNQGKRTIVVLRDGGNQLYSRCLMEAHLKRHLTPAEIVHHVNEDPTDDRIENLHLVTRAEHLALHRDQVLGARRTRAGDDHPCTKISDAQVIAMRVEHASAGTTAAEFARRFGVHYATAHNILRGKTRAVATANV